MLNQGKTLQLNNIGYKEIAGTYKCTVKGIGGQSSGYGTLEVYCEYNIGGSCSHKSFCLCN